MVFHFKSCPKCRGDMFNSTDVYGDYKRCLQCGFMNETYNGRGVRVSAIVNLSTGKSRAAQNVIGVDVL